MNFLFQNIEILPPNTSLKFVGRIQLRSVQGKLINNTWTLSKIFARVPRESLSRYGCNN